MIDFPDMPGDEDEDDDFRRVQLVIEDDRWIDADLEMLAQRAADAVADWMNMPELQIVVLGCDDERIAGLNAEFRGKPIPTNVLSWPSSAFPERSPGARPTLPPMPEIGDIAIAYDTCEREAKAQDKPFADHVTHLLVHGTLHLAGFDHIDDLDAETMEGSEREILARLGISDPYLEYER